MEINKSEFTSLPKSRLVSPDLLPTSQEDRHLTAMEMFWTWVGMSVLLTTFTIGANLFPSLSISMILLAVAFGNAIVVVILAFTGDIGVTYGIPFAVYLRVCYGYFGTNIPSIIRSLPAMFWLGFQSYLGAVAINAILVILTKGGWSGNFTSMLIILILFIAVQVVTTARGIKAIAWFEKLVSPLMVIIGLYMVYWIMSSNNITFMDIITTPAGPVPEGQMTYTFGYAVTSSTGYWATMSLNILDFTRYYKAPDSENWYQRNKGLIWSQAAGIIITMVFFAFIGAAAMVATGLWNPVDVITNMNAPMFLTIIALIVAALAQWSTNIGANILPPANIFANVFAPKVNFTGGCIIAGIIAFAMQTWKYGAFLITIFAYISGALGAIAGTMIVDYYILRKRKINIHDLYKFDGQYKYWKNYNPAAFIAYAAGFICALLFLEWAFLVSGVVGGIVYFLLMRYWIAKKYNQTEIIENFKIK